jgi:hypothetical protein
MQQGSLDQFGRDISAYVKSTSLISNLYLNVLASVLGIDVEVL